MQKWVTVASFGSAHEAGIAKTLLESEGILCNLKNELLGTLRYPPSVEIELQITDGDLKEGLSILMEKGIVKANRKTDANHRHTFIDKIPILNKIPTEFRLYILIGIAIVLLFVLIGLILV